MSTPAPDVVTAAPAEAEELAQVLSFMEAHEARMAQLPASRSTCRGLRSTTVPS